MRHKKLLVVLELIIGMKFYDKYLKPEYSIWAVFFDAHMSKLNIKYDAGRCIRG